MLAARAEETTPEPFTMADERYTGLKQYLTSAEALGMEAADLERELGKRGLKLLRDMLQAHLDTRGPGEVASVVTDAEGVERPDRRLHERGFESAFGTVRVRRFGYASEGLDSLHPLDADLNLPQELYSFEVRRRVAKEVLKGSFEEAVQAIRDTTGAEVPKRQAEELACRAAQDFDEFYEKRRENAGSDLGQGSVLVLTFDGKGVPMHKADLRKATRKAAEKRLRKLLTRLSRGEKNSSKRMSTVAAVYTVAPFVRTPEEFQRMLMRSDGDDVAKKRAAARPKPETKRVWASLKKEPCEVIEEAILEAERRDPDHIKKWTVLIDGAEVQLDLVEEIASIYGVEITVIVDIIHVTEYVWKASLAFCKEGDPQRECWVWDRMQKILDGNAANVAAGMRGSATLRGLSAAARKPVDTCAGYLLKYANYMKYNTYLAQGLPIATGVIEGACRHLVRDRMELTGARWRLEGAEAVVRLRALRASGDFDEYWDFHEAREYERNHASHYAGGQPPSVKALSAPQSRPRLRRVK